MKLAIRAAALAAVVAFSSAASAASTSGSLSFDWAGMTITNWLGSVSTSNGSPSFDAYAYNGSLSQSNSGAQAVTVSVGTAEGSAGISGLSASATNGSVNLTSNFYKQINLTGARAVYEVILPYTYSFVASALPGGGTAGMSGDIELAADVTFAGGSSQRNRTSLFSSYGSTNVEAGGIETKSGSGVLTLQVAASADTRSLYISAYSNLSGGAYTPTAPVPEPETYAMLLAGLGLMGAITRRRSANRS